MRWILLALAFAFAQPVPITPVIPVTPPDPTPSAPAVVAPSDDPRIARCAAPTLPGWTPYRVRSNDALPMLLVGTEGVSATDVALLNCLDDPYALPAGAVIWLPPGAMEMPTTTPETTADATPRIVRFEADADTISNLESVELSWEAEGGQAYLLPCPQEDCEIANAPVPLESSVELSLFPYGGTYHYRLTVAGGDSEAVSEEVTFEVTCAYEWLVSPSEVNGYTLCPTEPPRSVYAVAQPFERGWMVWFSDTRQIYVFIDGDRFQVFEDTWEEGQPDPAEQAPGEFLTPVRGFGRVWAQLGGTESGLGWGTAREGGYDALIQPAGQLSYTTYLTVPSGEVFALTEVPGTGSGYWQPLPQPEL
jgi:hypothetical protein